MDMDISLEAGGSHMRVSTDIGPQASIRSIEEVLKQLRELQDVAEAIDDAVRDGGSDQGSTREGAPARLWIERLTFSNPLDVLLAGPLCVLVYQLVIVTRDWSTHREAARLANDRARLENDRARLENDHYRSVSELTRDGRLPTQRADGEAGGPLPEPTQVDPELERRVRGVIRQTIGRLATALRISLPEVSDRDDRPARPPRRTHTARQPGELSEPPTPANRPNPAAPKREREVESRVVGVNDGPGNESLVDIDPTTTVAFPGKHPGGSQQGSRDNQSSSPSMLPREGGSRG